MKKQDSTIVLLKYLKRETEEQSSEHGLRQLVFCLLTVCNSIWRYRHVTLLINIIGEKFGTVLQPINMADEYDGIELKTLAAINDDDMVYIYFTLTDLKENRIDSKIDIYDFVVKILWGLIVRLLVSMRQPKQPL